MMEIGEAKAMCNQNVLSTCKNLSKNKLIETGSSLSDTFWQHFHTFGLVKYPTVFCDTCISP